MADLPTVPLLIAGFILLFLYQYIYISRKRYELITSVEYKEFNLSYKSGMIIILLFYVISFILPFALATYIGIIHKQYPYLIR